MDNNGNKRIEEILNSLDGVNRAKTPDFFFTRLRAKMQTRLDDGAKGLFKNRQPKWILRPVYIVSILLLVLAVNAFVFLKSQDETTTATANNDESVQQSIAAEYNIYDINTVYDLNQDK